VDAHPGDLRAPLLGPALGVGQVDECLAVEEVPAYIWDSSLDPGLGVTRRLRMIGTFSNKRSG
jgi:hypothetical protein